MAWHWRVLVAGAWLGGACTGDPGSGGDDTESGADDDGDDDDDDDDDGPVVEESDGGSSSGSPATESSGPTDPDTGATETGSSTTEPGTESSTDTSTGDDTVGPGADCDPFAQDCPPGEKCSAWADDGGGSWNATKCVPIAEDPDQPGEACTVEASPVSGVDSCDLGSMCWDVDGALHGTCVPLCTGTSDDPACGDFTTTCSITNGGALNLCLPICNPLIDQCDDDQGCYIGGTAFVCSPDGSGAAGQQGDECMYVNACDPGLVCMDGDYVPGCTDPACCTAVCDISSLDACAGLGVPCVPAYAEGTAPPGLELVGFCIDV
jgi:hypothetical protein